MRIVSKSQSGRACAEPASGPSAPRSGGGAKRRALTPVSTRARCWLDDAAGDHDILRSTRVQFLSVPRARQCFRADRVVTVLRSVPADVSAAARHTDVSGPRPVLPRVGAGIDRPARSSTVRQQIPRAPGDRPKARNPLDGCERTTPRVLGIDLWNGLARAPCRGTCRSFEGTPVGGCTEPILGHFPRARGAPAVVLRRVEHLEGSSVCTTHTR